MSFYKLLLILPITLILFLITGCSTSDKKIDTNLIGEFDNAPSWVTTKQLDAKVSEVAKNSNDTTEFKEQRDSAISNAQSSLNKKVHIKVINIFKLLNDVNLDVEKYKSNVQIATDEIVELSQKKYKTMKLWQSNSKNLYVLVSIDNQEIKDAIRNSVKTTFKDMPLVGSNYSLQLEQGNIDIELSQ